MVYTLGLRTGGLMEDPEWRIIDIKNVTAETLREAKEKYASYTRMDKNSCWNAETQTYFGWPIVQIIE